MLTVVSLLERVVDPSIMESVLLRLRNEDY
jgi:hypothetical protein